jgi:hypothetical protein
VKILNQGCNIKRFLLSAVPGIEKANDCLNRKKFPKPNHLKVKEGQIIIKVN